MTSSWPGNVRQLRNVVDRLAVFAEDDDITPLALAELGELGAVPAPSDGSLRGIARTLLDRLPGQDPIRAIEDALVVEAMERAHGRKSEAAELLGVHRKVVERRLSRGNGTHGEPHASAADDGDPV